MDEFIKKFISSISNLQINVADADLVLKLSTTLVDQLHDFNLDLMEDENGMSPVQVLQVSRRYVRTSIYSVNSNYKRKKNVVANSRYVDPIEIAIGTRWENYKKKSNGFTITIPRLIQSSFQYVPILQTLEALFSYEDFVKMYYEYNCNRVQNHICSPGKYFNFCCGSTFKSMQLFNDQPHSLQLQIANDDFNPNNPLGSKSNSNKTCAVYLSIQNIPVKFLSTCKFVFLVALCNSNDLKTEHTDFNNIWYPIVNELKVLESTGIKVSGHPRLKELWLLLRPTILVQTHR